MKELTSAIALAFGLCAVSTDSVKAVEVAPPAFSSAAREAIKAALDPANGAPIREPVYDCARASPHACDRIQEFRFLGPPGPYLPERAERNLLGSAAVLQCKVAISGALNDCSALADFPKTFAFDAAAQHMAKDGYLTAKPVTDAPDNQIARIIVVFPKPPHI